MAITYGNGGGYTVQLAGPFGSVGSGTHLGQLHLPRENWKGGESPFFQTLTLDTVSALTKVDLLPSPQQLEAMRNQELALTTENNGGTVTVYAIGSCPQEDLTLQILLTEIPDRADGQIIRGNTLGTTARPADYGQTDPSRADFISNKPDAAIARAQATADGAKKTAEAALPKGGGEMTGSLDMGANPITNLADPIQDGDGVSKGYLVRYADSRIFHGTVQLTAAGWSAAAPYTQTVALEGILATDQPHYGVVYSGNWEAEKEAFSCVDDLDTAENALTFTCYEEKPEINLTIQLEVNR